MGRRAVTNEQKSKLLEHFRTDPEPGSPASFTRAAVVTGLDRRTCRRAWKVGWPGSPAIVGLLDSVRVLARASLRREVLAQRLEAATALAMEDAAEARAQQGKSVRAVQATATAGLIALHAEGIATYMRSLFTMIKNGNPGEGKAVAARHALADLSLIIRRLTASTRLGVEMERLLFGEPTTILGGEIALRPVTPDTDAASLAIEVEAAQRALDEVKALEAKKGGGDGDGSGAEPN